MTAVFTLEYDLCDEPIDPEQIDVRNDITALAEVKSKLQHIPLLHPKHRLVQFCSKVNM